MQCNILVLKRNRNLYFMSEKFEFNLENSQSQMRKGTLEFFILLIISIKGKIYAPEILEELNKVNLVVVEGTLYPLLNRLKQDAILDYTWEESKSGHPRKYYSVTAKGKKFIQHLINHWQILQISLNSLIKNYEQNNSSQYR